MNKHIIYADATIKEICYIDWQEDHSETYFVPFTAPPQSHNVAEYIAVINALQYALSKGYKGIEVRSDSQLIVNQINGSYDYGFYDACAVMIRRLMESLIIEIFFTQNKVSEIKSNNVIISLDKLINKVINDSQIHLGRNTLKGMNLIKDLGDMAAHDRTYITRKEDIDDNKNSIRKTINELLVLAGILK